ncbi:hypothetical protein DKM19_43890 [Streptosporangium sp. 'caverna']|nr:hypothetical protein DKM19_43890 [Streptosporangium sp. 'caverna']
MRFPRIAQRAVDRPTSARGSADHSHPAKGIARFSAPMPVIPSDAKSSRKLRTALKGFAMAAVLATATVGPVASPASAAAAAGCQTRAATLWGYGGPLNFKCSGANKTSAIAYAFSAGPWSGAVYTIEDDPYFFCDGASFNIRDRTVYEVYLNATKPARCK